MGTTGRNAEPVVGLRGERHAPTLRELVDGSDWKSLRDLRLAALKDSGEFFLASGEPHWSDEEWQSEVTKGRWFELSIGATPIGLMKLAKYPNESPCWHMEGLWVSPTYRSRGLGVKLVERAEEFAASQGERQLGLWVTDNNDKAAEFYQRLGYLPTGRTGPLGTGTETEMAKRLVGQ